MTKNNPAVTFICNNEKCNVKTTRARWEYDRTTLHFCSQTCAKTHRNAHTKYPAPGTKKHQLTIIDKFTHPKYNSTYYNCICDCGEITIVSVNKWGSTQTCGNRTNHKGTQSSMFEGCGELSMSHWNQIVRGATSRKLEITITIESAWELFNQQQKLCALSGTEINLDKNYNREVTASLDRIDSSKGYTSDNVQWVHKAINKLKMELSVIDFQEWCAMVVNRSGKFSTKLDFEDVLIKPQFTTIPSRSDVDLFTNTLTPLIPNVIPVIAANFDTVGSFEMARALMGMGAMTCLNKHYSSEAQVDFFSSLSPEEKNHVFLSIGSSDDDFNKLLTITNQVHVPNLCLDVANAYIPQVLDTIKKIKKSFPDSILMVGNIATPEPISKFVELGVNIIKIGVGSGGVCETRIVAGVGIPQFSCILDCITEAKRLRVAICSDGGCKYPSDVVKAFAGGADMVMVGSMLAGTDECAGDWIEKDGKRFLRFYGMSSHTAMYKYGKREQKYRASEGKLVEVESKGPVENTMQQILGGCRSACTYTNSKQLSALHVNAEFIKVYRTHNTSLK